MSTLKIYETEAKVNPPVILRLTKISADGCVSLYAVDSYGKPVDAGFLLDISSDGTVRLASGITKDLGFDLTEEGRLKVENY